MPKPITPHLCMSRRRFCMPRCFVALQTKKCSCVLGRFVMERTRSRVSLILRSNPALTSEKEKTLGRAVGGREEDSWRLWKPFFSPPQPKRWSSAPHIVSSPFSTEVDHVHSKSLLLDQIRRGALGQLFLQNAAFRALSDYNLTVQ